MKQEGSRVVKFRVWSQLLEKMYQNAWPVEHGFYVEVPYSSDMSLEKINSKYFSFLWWAHVPHLMQWTGLTDKNGKEIFEGDIVKVDRYAVKPTLHSIFYEDGSFCFRDEQKDETHSLFDHYGDNFEVIDNVYEHPSLLTETIP